MLLELLNHHAYILPLMELVQTGQLRQQLATQFVG
jgi:hypothetical protein